MPRVAGHQAGVDNLRRILEHCVRREVKVLQMEREILKKATAFFVKESK